MPYRYLTGRERRISFGGTYSWQAKYSFDFTDGATGDVYRVYADEAGTIPVGWAVAAKRLKTAQIQLGLDRKLVQGITVLPDPLAPRKTLGPRLRCPDPATPSIELIDDNGNVLDTVSFTWGGGNALWALDPFDAPTSIGEGVYASDLSIYGTETDSLEGSFSGDVEYVVDIEEAMLPYYTTPPNTGGTYNEARNISELERFAGQVPWNSVTFFECFQPTGRRGWILNGDDQTAEITTREVIGTTLAGWMGDVYWPYVSIGVTNDPTEAGTNTATLAATWDGGGYVVSPKPFSVSDTNGSASESHATASGGKASSSGSYFPVGYTNALIAHRYHLDAVAPDEWTVEWRSGFGSGFVATDTGTGALSRDFTFHYRLWSGNAGRTPGGGGGGGSGGTSTSGSEGSSIVAGAFPQPIGAVISDASASAISGYIQTLCFRGLRWEQFSIRQDQYKYYAIDPFHTILSFPWTGKGWRVGSALGVSSLSVVSGKLRVVVGSYAPATHQDRGVRLVGINERVETRYIGIRIRSVGSANQPFQLVMPSLFGGTGGDAYNGTTGADGVWTEHLFDVYEADDVGGVRAKPQYTAVVPGGAVTEIAVQGLAHSQTYEIEWIRGEKQDFSNLSATALLYLVSDTHQVRTVELNNTDASLSDLIPPPPVDTGDNDSSWVVADLAAPRIDLPDILTDPGPIVYLPLSDFQNSYNIMPFLTGIGLSPDGAVLDQATDTDSTLYAYLTGVFFTAYPGAGDVMGIAGSPYAYGEETPVWFGVQHRGRLFGPVLGAGYASQEVVLTELDVDDNDLGEYGRGTPDANHFYGTGTPYGRRRVIGSGFDITHHRAWLDDQIPDALQLALGDKSNIWVLWRTIGVNDIVSVDTSPTGRTSFVDIDGGEITLHHSINWETNAWEVIATGIAADGACLRYEWGGHRLYLAYITGGDIELVYSDDGGGSWTMPVTVASGASQQAFDVSPTGWLLVAWRDAGAIKARAFDAFGAALWAAVTAVASGADDAGIDVTWDESAQRWYILYRESGTVKTTVSADGGKTWS